MARITAKFYLVLRCWTISDWHLMDISYPGPGDEHGLPARARRRAAARALDRRACAFAVTPGSPDRHRPVARAALARPGRAIRRGDLRRSAAGGRGRRWYLADRPAVAARPDRAGRRGGGGGAHAGVRAGAVARRAAAGLLHPGAGGGADEDMAPARGLPGDGLLALDRRRSAGCRRPDGAAVWAWKALLLALSGSGRRPTSTTAAIPSSATRRSTGAGRGRGPRPGRPSRRRCSRRRCAAERLCEVLYWVAARRLALWLDTVAGTCAGMPLGGPVRRGGGPDRPAGAGRPGTVTRGTRGSHLPVIKCSSRLMSSTAGQGARYA